MYGMGAPRGGGFPPQQVLGNGVMDQAAAQGGQSAPSSQNLGGQGAGPDVLDDDMKQLLQLMEQIAGKMKIENPDTANQIQAMSVKLDKIRIKRQEENKAAQDLAQARAVINSM